MENIAHLSTTSAVLNDSSSLPNPLSRKAKRKARLEVPEIILRGKLNKCSLEKDLREAIRLYDEARVNKVPLNVDHYNVLLYLCTAGSNSGREGDGFEGVFGLKKGFEIYKQMSLDNVAPNEATFTNAARLAAAEQDPEMAFDLVKQMKACGILPKLRSYGPALFGFCAKMMAEKAYEVDAHMVENGVLAEEPELSALLKLSYEAEKTEKVYEMMHRMRAAVRQVSEETAGVVEDWFSSKSAEDIGKENWDVGKVKDGILKGGGGWHGQGWLGTGKWKVVRTEVDESGVCRSCGEKLICIDIDPKETENFGDSLVKLACEGGVKADFVLFQAWLRRHGPFDAVVDGANVSLVHQVTFSFQQLKCVVNQLREMSPSKKLPLVILHRNRVKRGPATDPSNKKFLESMKKAGALYLTPHGSNDDWYWLFAAVNSKCLLVTNDEMRDHLFQLLGTGFFPRWKEKHQVRLTPAKPGLNLHMPPPYSKVIQESEQGNWHVPTVVGDDLETPKQWVCATRKSSTLHSLFR